MINNVARVGNFTSSEIVALTANGKKKGTLGAPALNYILECNMERNLGRSIDTELNARPVTWGELGEKFVFENRLDTAYQLVSKDTIIHPEYPFWSGSPDANKFDIGRTVADIKCPNTLKSFCQLVYPLYQGKNGMEAMNILRKGIIDQDSGEVAVKKHPDGEKFYWQLVSNAILTDSKYAELIIFMPYKSELELIKEMAANLDSAKQYRYFWISNAPEDELPFIVEGGFYRNLNTIRFEVPEEDKKSLIERAVYCSKFLNKIQQAA